jgi:hypothetical protein
MKTIDVVRTRPHLKKADQGGSGFPVFFVTGCFVLPLVIQSVIMRQLSEKLGREVTFQTMKINPFMLSLTPGLCNHGVAEYEDLCFF